MKSKTNILKPDRTKTPSYGETVVLSINDPEEIKLDNGISAYLIEAGEEAVTRIDVVVKAGSAYQKKRLVATSTGKLLKSACAARYSFVLARSSGPD